jgi:flagellar FliJ protein
MARFVFSLEGVLRHRRNIEHGRQRELADATVAMQRLQDELRELDELLKQSNEEMRQSHLTGRIEMSWLVAHRRFVMSGQRKAVTLMQRIALAQRAVQEKRQALVEAARETKVLEKLREHQWEAWRAEQARKEFAELDEAGTQIAYRVAGDESLGSSAAGGES